jgi:hypothetical protein
MRARVILRVMNREEDVRPGSCLDGSHPHRCTQGPEITAPVWGPDGPPVGGCTTKPREHVDLGRRRHLRDLIDSWRRLPRRRLPTRWDSAETSSRGSQLRPRLRLQGALPVVAPDLLGDGRTTDGSEQRFRVPRRSHGACTSGSPMRGASGMSPATTTTTAGRSRSPCGSAEREPRVLRPR